MATQVVPRLEDTEVVITGMDTHAKSLEAIVQLTCTLSTFLDKNSPHKPRTLLERVAM